MANPGLVDKPSKAERGAVGNWAKVAAVARTNPLYSKQEGMP